MSGVKGDNSSTTIKRSNKESKMELYNMTQRNITAPFTTEDSAGAKLESLLDLLIARTFGSFEECLKDSDVSKCDITDVILAGGMTRVPKVQQTVEKFFGRSSSKSGNPDEVVAMEGGVLKGNLRGLILVDVTRLIDNNGKISMKISEVFSTENLNQSQVGIKVYQGEREMAADKKFLGHCDLVGIPQVEVTFDIDANEHANAKDKG